MRNLSAWWWSELPEQTSQLPEASDGVCRVATVARWPWLLLCLRQGRDAAEHQQRACQPAIVAKPDVRLEAVTNHACPLPSDPVRGFEQLEKVRRRLAG